MICFDLVDKGREVSNAKAQRCKGREGREGREAIHFFSFFFALFASLRLCVGCSASDSVCLQKDSCY
jgi:hypothetical protein